MSVLFTLATNLSYTVFLATSFLTTLLNLLKSTGTATNLSMSNLSDLKLAKFVFSAKLEVSTYKITLISAFVALFQRSTLTLIFPPKLLKGLGKY